MLKLLGHTGHEFLCDQSDTRLVLRQTTNGWNILCANCGKTFLRDLDTLPYFDQQALFDALTQSRDAGMSGSETNATP